MQNIDILENYPETCLYNAIFDSYRAIIKSSMRGPFVDGQMFGPSTNVPLLLELIMALQESKLVVQNQLKLRYFILLKELFTYTQYYM